MSLNIPALKVRLLNGDFVGGYAIISVKGGDSLWIKNT